MKIKPHTNKKFFQSLLFITVLFLYASCSNKSKTNKEQAKQENQKPGIVKQGSVFPPLVTIIDNLPDSGKPKEFFLEITPKAQIITIPPNIIPLAVLKNNKGEPIRDKDGKPFIMGEAGGTSSFTNYTTDQGLALDAITCGFRDKTGNLWFGTDGGGVSRYDGKSFTNFTTQQGLANNTVLSVMEDKNENLWFGTYAGGVSRYDGKSFTNFTTAQGLASNTVWAIMQDKTGNIWFGTSEGGLSRYDPSAKLRTGSESFTNFTIEQGLANNTVLSIAEDKTGNIWFGTYGGGVSRYDPSAKLRTGSESFTNFTTQHGLANNIVWSIAEDKKGNIWFGTEGGGVSRYDPSAKPRTGSESFTNFTTAQGLANNTVCSITEDNTGNIWFGTTGGGVSRYDPSAKLRTGLESFTNFTTQQGLANDKVRSITVDKTGNLWFGTYGGGVSRYDGKSFTNFTTAQGVTNNTVLSIAEDKTGIYWFGTYGGGVSRYDPSARLRAGSASFTNFTKAQGLANNIVWAITEDKMGNLWFGTTGGGLSRYAPSAKHRTGSESFTNFTKAQGLVNDNVRCIMEDKMGNLWFGTYGGGVSRYDGSRVEAIEAALQRGEIIPQETLQGLKKINGKLVKTFTNFTTEQGLANNTVWCITEDKTGNIWFGTSDGGVSRYDGNRVEAIEAALQRGEIIAQQTLQDLKKINGKFVTSFTNFTTQQGLANNTVLSIAEDKAGNIWFGTYAGGLSRYDPSAKLRTDSESFTNFTTAQGLPDNTITQITITKEKNIALGTNLGVGMLVGFTSNLQVNGSPHNIPAQNNLTNEELKNYTPVFEIYNSAMGYPVKDVNAGQNAMFEDSKGIIWIGTGADKTALVRFDYTALHKNKMALNVCIQRVKINNENICWHNLEVSKFKIQNSNLEQTDSTTTAPNITEEVTTFGKVLSDEERNLMRQKFRDVKFDGITKFYPIPENLVLPHRNNNITFDFVAIEPAKPYLVNYQYILEGYDNDWSPVTNKTTATFGNIYEGTYTFKLKAQSPFGVWSEPIEYKFTVLPPWWRTWWMYSVYGITAIALVVLIVWWNGSRLRAKATELTEEVRKATHTITEKQKEIIDSITYAKRIQRAMLPHRKDIWAAFPQSFVLFKPKDIVSGDFYFFNKNNECAFIAVADCTGHGVPGAFMSVIGSTKLNDAVSESSDTSEILSLLNKGIKNALKQSDSDESTRDGMDIALCAVDIDNRIVKYAGANRPIWIVRKGLLEVEEIKATKKAIGGLTENNQHFESHEIKLQQGDTFYICTDGYADQFGGKEGKKLMTKKLKEVLIEIQNKSMKEQEQHLDTFIENWKAGLEQIDDILIIGVRV